MVVITKKQKILLFICSFIMNTALFLLDISFYNCVFATNDDYRMSLIVSGAYTGKPSANLVFMKYPIALLMSSLYKITTAVPWYGIGTMLCIFVPSCIICYFMLRESKKSGHIIIGFLIYLLFYLLITQKHVVLPQFTLTAAYMTIAWLVLLWYMPKERSTLYVIITGVIAAIAFSIRMKAFMMIVPAALLVVLINLIKERFADKKYILKYCICFAISIVLCTVSQVSDSLNTDKEYHEFNTARSSVYDFDEMPSYEANKEFYDASGIDETVYYDISARYLDLDKDITTENLRSVSEHMQECESPTPSVIKMIQAFFSVPSVLFELGLEYQTRFTVLMFMISIFAAIRMRKGFITATILCTSAGMILEMTFLCFISRFIDRLGEVCLLTISIICILSLNNVLSDRSDTKKSAEKPSKDNNIWIRVCRILSLVCLLAVSMYRIVANQEAITLKSQGQNQVNSRLIVLNQLAANDKESFYFYDSYDFIAASSDVFSVYDGMVNTDSLGNWYINSPDYFERNSQYGITNSIDGLIDGNKNIYYASIGNLKNGIVLTMKERYNMEPVIIESVPYKNNNIYIYTFVPCG